MDGTLLSCSTDEDNFFAIANVEFMATLCHRFQQIILMV